MPTSNWVRWPVMYLASLGRAILRALMKEEKDPEVLAELSKGRLRNKIPQLRRALEGQVTAHHRSLLTGHWNRMEFLERQIADCETQIAQGMKPTPEEMALTIQTAAKEAPLPLSPRRKRFSYGWRYPASGGRRLAAWSPNLGSIWTNSHLPPTWRVGPGCVPAITKAPASV